jgi:colanic acid biosynthesis glycosyl transferase WcaI
LLAAAEQLAGDREIIFCFIGGGSEWRKIKQLVESPPTALSPQLSTINRQILCLPYQPLDQLSASLSAADLHVVVLGQAMLGLVHPCKIYNILSVTAPVLYIGPRPSHVTEILDATGPESLHVVVAHGDTDRVVQQIRQLRQRTSRADRPNSTPVLAQFSQATLVPQLVAVIEAADVSVPAGA